MILTGKIYRAPLMCWALCDVLRILKIIKQKSGKAEVWEGVTNMPGEMKYFMKGKTFDQGLEGECQMMKGYW